MKIQKNIREKDKAACQQMAVSVLNQLDSRFKVIQNEPPSFIEK